MIYMPTNGKRLSVAASIVNCMEGWASFRVVSEAHEWSRTKGAPLGPLNAFMCSIEEKGCGQNVG